MLLACLKANQIIETRVAQTLGLRYVRKNDSPELQLKPLLAKVCQLVANVLDMILWKVLEPFYLLGFDRIGKAFC